MSEADRLRIHQHLYEHPGLTAYELARVLGLPSMDTAKRELMRMLHDGEARYEEADRAAGDKRARRLWRAT